MSKKKRLERIRKKAKLDRRSPKQTAILAVTLLVPLLIIVFYNLALIKKQRPLARIPRQRVQVFFYNSERRCLTRELRQIPWQKEPEARARELFTQLQEGPVGLSRPTLHHLTKLLSVRIDERKVLELTLNSYLEKEPMGYQVPWEMRRYSLVNTLMTNLNQEISGVAIKVKGGASLASGRAEAPLALRPELICPDANPPAAP